MGITFQPHYSVSMRLSQFLKQAFISKHITTHAGAHPKNVKGGGGGGSWEIFFDNLPHKLANFRHFLRNIPIFLTVGCKIKIGGGGG